MAKQNDIALIAGAFLIIIVTLIINSIDNRWLNEAKLKEQEIAGTLFKLETEFKIRKLKLMGKEDVRTPDREMSGMSQAK